MEKDPSADMNPKIQLGSSSPPPVSILGISAGITSGKASFKALDR